MSRAFARCGDCRKLYSAAENKIIWTALGDGTRLCYDCVQLRRKDGKECVVCRSSQRSSEDKTQ